jgi:toxin ParE1/3/4
LKRAILVRPAAERDLDEQAEYLASHGNLELALRFYRAAEVTFELLAGRPRIGKVNQFRSRFLSHVRTFPLKGFPKHLVFYLPIEDGVEIIRVLHGARDLEILFRSE